MPAALKQNPLFTENTCEFDSHPHYSHILHFGLMDLVLRELV